MLIINSMINRKMIAFLSYIVWKTYIITVKKKLEDTSSPSKIRDYNRWLSTSITANETSWKFDTDASWWRAEKGRLHNHLLAQTPKTSHGTNVKRIHIPNTALQLCFCMFCHWSCRGSSDNNPISRISADNYALAETKASGMPSDTPRPNGVKIPPREKIWGES